MSPPPPSTPPSHTGVCVCVCVVGWGRRYRPRWGPPVYNNLTYLTYGAHSRVSDGVPDAAKPLLKGRSVEATFRVKSSIADGNESDTNSHSALLLCDDMRLTGSSSKSNYELHELKDVNRLLTTRHMNQIWLRRCVAAWFRAIDGNRKCSLLTTPRPHNKSCWEQNYLTIN